MLGCAVFLILSSSPCILEHGTELGASHVISSLLSLHFISQDLGRYGVPGRSGPDPNTLEPMLTSCGILLISFARSYPLAFLDYIGGWPQACCYSALLRSVNTYFPTLTISHRLVCLVLVSCSAYTTVSVYASSRRRSWR
jgi:hypothetical protein